MDNLLGALLRGIERDALLAARQPVICDHRGREVYYAKAEPPMFRGGEIATSVDDIYGQHWAYGSTRYNPDMLAIKKGGLRVYHEMRLDDQAKAALHLKKSAIIHPGWTIEGKNEQIVDFLWCVFESMAGTVEDVARSILSAYDYGFSVHEKVYSYIEDGPFRGKIGVSSIKQKSPTRILFRTDDFGNILPDGIVQQQRDGQFQGMPVDKFVLFSYGKEFDNFYGESDLRAAYRFWFLKVNFFRYWGMYLEKFGMPLVLGKAPNAGLGPTDQAAFRALVANLQAGMSATLPKDLEVEFVEAARTDRGTFEQAINACDVRIARAVLVPTLLGLSAGQDKGSLARSQTEADTFDMVLGGDSRSVQDALNEQLVRPLIDINFGKQQEYPWFAFKPMREEDKKAFATIWGEMVSKGAARSTIETETHVRSLLGFPEMTPEEETEAREAKQAAQELANAGAEAAKNPPPGKNADDDKKPKTYVLTTLNAQEARKAWKDHVDALDGLEETARAELSDAFSGAIQAMAIDSKKNS